MSNLIVTDYGIGKELEGICTLVNSIPLYLRLFQNNHTPAHGDTIASYTEATFGGYAAIVVNDLNVIGVSLSVALAQAGVKVFICTGGPSNNIYGYYLTNASNTNVYWAQYDDLSPVPIGNLGDVYVVVPAITHKSEF